MLAPLSENLLTPHGVNAGQFREHYNPDAPVVVTRRADRPNDQAEPVLPGSGIRGPLRHATSRWLRGQPGCQQRIPDPNDPAFDAEKDYAQAEKEEGNDRKLDPISSLFGLVTNSARLLVRDGLLVPAPGHATGPSYRLALFQHHAEDKFAGGVHGPGKFDRTAVIKGTFKVQLVIEARDRNELAGHIRTLAPGLRLAELGHLPIGGAKWRGFGWIPWRFTRLELTCAGDPEPVHSADNEERSGDWIASNLQAVLNEHLGQPASTPTGDIP